MYGQLYHRTISRELPEPQRDPRGRVRRGGWQGAGGRRWLHRWTRPGWLGARTRLARVGAQAVPASAHRWARCVGVGSTRAAGRARSAAHPDRNGRRGGWLGTVDAMRAAKRDAYKTAAMNAGGRHKRDGRGARMRQAGQARAAGRKARSAGPQAAAAERLRGAGSIFASCVISGSSTRKWALGGKIRAPCILNRPIAPGNGCIGRGCCHLDLEKHAFRAEVARKGSFFAHSTKKGCMRCDSCQPWPRGRRNARGGGRGRRRAVGAMGAMRAGLPDGNDLDDDSGSARWRHRGTRAAGSSA